MAWFKVDDGFWSHPKTATLSDAAVTLWVRAGSYSCQHLTDGVIHAPVLRLIGDAEAVAELVDAGLWLKVDGGWRFHDWDEYQETSEAVKKRRADARDRQRRAREVAAEKRRKSRSESRVTDGVTDGVSNGVSSLYPTRPDPTRPIYEEPRGSSSSRIAEPEIRPDIEGLLDLLDEGLRSNGTKTPKRTKQNIDAARLLIDRDGYTIPQVEYLIRWSQSDEFWRANIRSMSKLREKADTLRLQSQRQVQQKPAVSKADQAHDFISRLEAIDATHRSGEAAHDHRELGQSQT